ncbi:MAG: hypothetical protein ABEJ96_00850, partial [Thiohalorhabdaceae bacterium]
MLIFTHKQVKSLLVAAFNPFYQLLIGLAFAHNRIASQACKADAGSLPDWDTRSAGEFPIQGLADGRGPRKSHPTRLPPVRGESRVAFGPAAWTDRTAWRTVMAMSMPTSP